MMQHTEAEAYTLCINDSSSWNANEKSEIKFRIFLEKQLLLSIFLYPCEYLVFICILPMTYNVLALR
jgi:hypothetical protein